MAQTCFSYIKKIKMNAINIFILFLGMQYDPNFILNESPTYDNEQYSRFIVYIIIITFTFWTLESFVILLWLTPALNHGKMTVMHVSHSSLGDLIDLCDYIMCISQLYRHRLLWRRKRLPTILTWIRASLLRSWTSVCRQTHQRPVHTSPPLTHIS